MVGTGTYGHRAGGKSLTARGFARSVAHFRHALNGPLALTSGAAQSDGVSHVTSNTCDRSENRYPSPLAGAGLPPFCSRRLSFGAVRRPFSAYQGIGIYSSFAGGLNSGKTVAGSTSKRAETCVNPFSLSPSSPSRVSPRAWTRPTSSVPPQAPLWAVLRAKSCATANASPVRPSAAQPALWPTTSNIARAHRAPFELTERFPGWPARGPFFMPSDDPRTQRR